MTFLKQQEPHFTQGIPFGYRPALVVAVADQHEILLEQLEFGERGFGDRQRHDGKIEFALQQLLEEPCRLRFAHVDLNTVEGGGEIVYDGGQEIGRDGRDDADPQPRKEGIACGAGKFPQFIHSPQDVAGAVGEGLAEGGQFHVPGAALEQIVAKFRLQLLDLHGERGLGDGAGLGGKPEAAMPGQGLEIAKLLERKVRHNENLS